MEKRLKPIKIFYDRTANSLVIWFDDPKKEAFVEETGEEILISKDKRGRTIGFEVLNFSMPLPKAVVKTLPVEALVI